MAPRQQVSCRDALGRSRSAVVFAASFGRVGIQVPPGEVMVLTMSELNDLWLAAMSVTRPDHPVSPVGEAPAGPPGKRASPAFGTASPAFGNTARLPRTRYPYG
jgi:hypothetical protein